MTARLAVGWLRHRKMLTFLDRRSGSIFLVCRHTLFMGIQFPFQIRCGIHTGMANVGNYGSEGFMEYSAIGLNTNLASRLEQACQPGEIYLSHATRALVSAEIPCEEVGKIEIRGFHYPIQTYRVLPVESR